MFYTSAHPIATAKLLLTSSVRYF